jgi:hypothetical protein
MIQRELTTWQLFSAYWLLNIVFQSIKVARLKKVDQLDAGGSKYPTSDQLLDNAIIVRVR